MRYLRSRRRAAATLLFAAGLFVSVGALPSRACDDASFDLTVSLEVDPQTDLERTRYEDVIRDFGDVVYQATECRHRLGTVHVWPRALAHDRADVVWPELGPAMASPNGLAHRGLRLYVANTFQQPDPDGVADPSANDIPLVFDATVDARTPGAILGHEWAHYAYGLRDEHVVEPGDVPVVPSLLHSPWTAAHDPSWRNFSIPGSGGPFEDTGATAQHRRFGRSAWAVLSDAAIALDERLLSPTPGFVERRAQGLAPPPGMPGSNEGSAPPAIVWHDVCSSYVIAIDNSGSMAGAPLARAASAAIAIVDAARADATWLSVLSFHETAVLRRGPALVSDAPDAMDESERDRFVAAIEDVAAVPKNTAFSVGLAAAFPVFGACAESPSTRALFFVTDGSNGADAPLDPLIAPYASAGIPIYVLDVGTTGSAVDTVPLAAQTGGIVFGPAATTPQGQEAWATAESALAPETTVQSGLLTVAPGGASVSTPIATESTVARLRVCATATGPVELEYVTPSGIALLPGSVRDPVDATDTCSTYFATASAGSGAWQLVATPSDDATGPVDVAWEAVSTSRNSTYTLDAWLSAGDSLGLVQAPAPIVVTAALWHERPISGARVVMQIDGGAEVVLRDDGLPPDALARDGLYVGAAVGYDPAGCESDPTLCPVVTVHASNPFGSAAQTVNGLVLAPGPNGDALAPESDVFLGEDFERELSFVVPTLAADPAPTIDDPLQPLSGRIEAPTDPPDRFSIDLCGGVLPSFATSPEPLEVRASGALLGMSPAIEVFLGDPDDPTTPSVTGTAVPGEAGVAVVVDAAQLACAAELWVEVSHATGGVGTYQIGAGPVLGLAFGVAGTGDAPCDQAWRDQQLAIVELDRGVPGLAPATLLLVESGTTETELLAALDALPSPTDEEKQAAKALKGAIKKNNKAYKLAAKLDRKSGKNADKDAKRIAKLETRIETAQEDLLGACSMLTGGGAPLFAAP